MVDGKSVYFPLRELHFHDLKTMEFFMKSASSKQADFDAITKPAHVLYEGNWYAIPSALSPMYALVGMKVSTSIPAHLAANADKAT